jgi:phospholipase/carboxylesterase
LRYVRRVTKPIDIAGLLTRIIGPADAATTVVLLHGFGAPGDDLVPLAGELATPNVRFVVPEAALELGGLYGDSRAWWLLDLAKLEQELREGIPRDRRDEIPAGLPAVRAQVGRFLDQLQARFDVAPDKLVLAGFSQGAMLALDVALHRETKPAALLLMSGTLLAESEWVPRMGSLAGIPIVLSHGRNDMLLPYSIAELLRDRLRDAGAAVEWVPFLGGHEIPRVVLAAASDLLGRLS